MLKTLFLGGALFLVFSSNLKASPTTDELFTLAELLSAPHSSEACSDPRCEKKSCPFDTRPVESHSCVCEVVGSGVCVKDFTPIEHSPSAVCAKFIYYTGAHEVPNYGTMPGQGSSLESPLHIHPAYCGDDYYIKNQ